VVGLRKRPTNCISIALPTIPRQTGLSIADPDPGRPITGLGLSTAFLKSALPGGLEAGRRQHRPGAIPPANRWTSATCARMACRRCACRAGFAITKRHRAPIGARRYSCASVRAARAVRLATSSALTPGRIGKSGRGTASARPLICINGEHRASWHSHVCRNGAGQRVERANSDLEHGW
jgi:hypothetical protein